ncbi:MAG TPA: protease modulator HflK N-terminal domain-containing protein, partial [Paralcaligenes sp.]
MRLISRMFNLNDPGWGRGNNDGSEPPRRPEKPNGPPDLDEVWRDFNNRLGALFGRKPKRGGQFGGGGGGHNGANFQLPKSSPKMLIIGVIVIVA